MAGRWSAGESVGARMIALSPRLRRFALATAVVAAAGAPLVGGPAFLMPFGTLSATNITPDPGIESVLRRGAPPHGQSPLPLP
jgi:hypothetical protein